MENLLENLNLINFEKLDYHYSVESLIIDINKLQNVHTSEIDLKQKKKEKEKSKAGDKKENKSSNKQKHKKKKVDDIEKELNLSKQSSNMSIFVIPNVKKTQNYDIQLNKLDSQVNKTKIKYIKKNDFEKVKKILAANNISMNVHQASKMIQDLKARNNATKKHVGLEKSNRENIDHELNKTNQNTIFNSETRNIIETEEVVDTLNPQRQLNDIDVDTNFYSEKSHVEKNTKAKDTKKNIKENIQSHRLTENAPETVNKKEIIEKEGGKNKKNKNDKEKGKEREAPTTKFAKNMVSNADKLESKKPQEKQSVTNLERDKNSSQNLQNKRVDDFIKNLKEKKLCKTKETNQEIKQYLKQSFYDKNKYMFILDPTQRLKLRDLNILPGKDIFLQYFDLANKIFSNMNFYSDEALEIDYIKQNIKEYGILTDNLIEIFEIKNEINLILLILEMYISQVRQIFGNFPDKYHSNYIHGKALILNCLYSSLKFLSALSSNLQNPNDNKNKILNNHSITQQFQSILLNINYVLQENENNLKSHVDVIENLDIINKKLKIEKNEKDLNYLLSANTASKSLDEYNFREDENLNYLVLIKVISYAILKNIAFVKKSLSNASNEEDELNIKNFFNFDYYPLNSSDIIAKEEIEEKNSSLRRLISFFSDSVNIKKSTPKNLIKNYDQTADNDHEENDNQDLIELDNKKRYKKTKGYNVDSSNNKKGVDHLAFKQMLSCLKFFTGLNLNFESQKNKINNLTITVSKLIVSILNEIKNCLLTYFANEFYSAINDIIQIYILNLKDLFETNEHTYSEVSDLINLVVEENIQNLPNNLSIVPPFSKNNKFFDIDRVNNRIFQNFDFINVDLNYFLDDTTKVYLQTLIKYLKLPEKLLKYFFKHNSESIENSVKLSLEKSQNKFYIITYLGIFNKILMSIVCLKSHNIKPIYSKFLIKSLEGFFNSDSNKTNQVTDKNFTLFTNYILLDLRFLIINTLVSSNNNNILKSLKIIRESVHFYANFPQIKIHSLDFINNPSVFEEDSSYKSDENSLHLSYNNKGNMDFKHSIYILMLLNLFDFNDNHKSYENQDLKLFKNYIENIRKDGTSNYFDHVMNFNKTICYFYLNNYVDSEINQLETLRTLISIYRNHDMKKALSSKSQYEILLDNLKNLISEISDEKFLLEKNIEKNCYHLIFNELKRFENLFNTNIKVFQESNYESLLVNESKNEFTYLSRSLTKTIYDLMHLLKEANSNVESAEQERNEIHKNFYVNKSNIIQSLIMYFINKKDNLNQSLNITVDANIDNIEFYDEILFNINNVQPSITSAKEKEVKIKYNIMEEIKINNEKLISKAITLNQSNKQYPNKIKKTSDLFEYFIQILKLEVLLNESENAEKTKEMIKLKNKKNNEEDILIQGEVVDLNIKHDSPLDESEKINVIENIDKLNQDINANKATENNLATQLVKKNQPENYNNFQHGSFIDVNMELKEEEETIANLDLILKLFIEYLIVVGDELKKAISFKFSKLQNDDKFYLDLEGTLFNLMNYLESITKILKNHTFFKSFVKNLDLLELFLKKYLQIKDICYILNKKLLNQFKNIQQSDSKIFDYNTDFILDTITLNELTDKVILITSDALKNRFKSHLIYIFNESELFKHLMINDIEASQIVSYEMEEFYKKSIFDQHKVTNYLKRINDEENDLLEDVMHEIYSKEVVKYLEYPEEVIDMLSTINEAVQNDFKIFSKKFFYCVFPYFYLWKTIISKIEYGLKLFTADKRYVDDLDNYKMLLKFNINYFERNTKLYNTFCLIVVSLLHILDEDRHLIDKKDNDSTLNFENFDEKSLLNIDEKIDSKILFEFILNILYKFVKIFPSLVKYYYDQLQGKLKTVFKSLITNIILPKMLTHLKAKIDSNKVMINKFLFI